MRYAALALLLAAACTPLEQRSDEMPAPAPQGGSVAAEFSDPAAPIETRAGQEFTIVLRANTTTGYAWMLADSLQPGRVALVREEYVSDPHPAGMTGVGGRARWTFRALAPGEAAIRMRHGWTRAQSPEDETARFRIIIRPAAP